MWSYVLIYMAVYKSVIQQPGAPYLEKLCLRTRAILKTEDTVFPNMDWPRLVDNIFIFSTRIQGSSMATNHTINSPRITGKTERFRLLPEPIRLHDKYRILPACELKKYKQLYCKFNLILMEMIFIYAAVPRHWGQGAKSRVLLMEFP